MADLKVWQVNDCDWLVGESLEAAKAQYLEMVGLSPEEAFDDPHELSKKEMETLQFTDDGVTRSFADQLQFEIANGGPKSVLFASTEY